MPIYFKSIVLVILFIFIMSSLKGKPDLTVTVLKDFIGVSYRFVEVNEPVRTTTCTCGAKFSNGDMLDTLRFGEDDPKHDHRPVETVVKQASQL